jgi:serine protease AprX
VKRRRLVFIKRAAVALVCVLGLAAPALAGGPPTRQGHHPKLDRALARRASVSAGESRVIIELVDGAPADLVARGVGGVLGRRLRTFRGTVALVRNNRLEALANHPWVKRVYFDRPVVGEMSRTASVIGARTVQQVMGFNGSGIGVAIIDSGITSWHDDLAGSGLGNQRVARFVDLVNGRPTPYDDNGHGTHVAGIIAGDGHDSYGGRAGIAPGVNLVALKVLDEQGAGHISDVIAALDWVVANRTAYNLRVVNLSVGAPVVSSYWSDPLTLAAKAAVDAGVVVVAAAGNLGKNAEGQIQHGAITAPGNAPWVLTVGASSHMGTVARYDDQMASFSSRGPTAVDFAAKPDIVAPGVGIVSLSDPTSLFYSRKASFLLPGSRSTAYLPYLSLSGTSMAAPVVTGTVALMLQANPALTPNAVKAILEFTAQVYQGYGFLTQGAGFLNARGAVELARFYRTATPGATFPKSRSWSRRFLWGNHRIGGGIIMPGANAWASNVVWGADRDADGDNIVWGTQCPSYSDCENIVWGNAAELGDNIVWGTEEPLDNIVWGNNVGDDHYAGDNIVWGTAADAENIVWGTDCGGADCENIVWGASVMTPDGDNIVWGTAESADNIVWGQNGDIDNIVWGASSDYDDTTWGSSGTDAAVFAELTTAEEQLAADPTAFDRLFEPEPITSPPGSAPPDTSPTAGSSTPTGSTGGGF